MNLEGRFLSRALANPRSESTQDRAKKKKESTPSNVDQSKKPLKMRTGVHSSHIRCTFSMSLSLFSPPTCLWLDIHIRVVNIFTQNHPTIPRSAMNCCSASDTLYSTRTGGSFATVEINILKGSPGHGISNWVFNNPLCVVEAESWAHIGKVD